MTWKTQGNIIEQTRTTTIDDIKVNIRAAMENHLSYQKPVNLGSSLSTPDLLAEQGAIWIDNHVGAIMSVKDKQDVPAVDHLSIPITDDHRGIHLFSERGVSVYLLSSGDLAEVIVTVRKVSHKDAAARYGGRNVCDSICEAATKLNTITAQQLTEDRQTAGARS